MRSQVPYLPPFNEVTVPSEKQSEKKKVVEIIRNEDKLIKRWSDEAEESMEKSEQKELEHRTGKKRQSQKVKPGDTIPS